MSLVTGLNLLKYNQLVQIAEKEEIPRKKRKNLLIKAILEKVAPQKITQYLKEFHIESVDILSHELVPKHEIMSKKDAKALLSQYKVTLFDLPKIFDTDPVVVQLGAKVGDIIRIIRKSATAGISEYYRVVIRSKTSQKLGLKFPEADWDTVDELGLMTEEMVDETEEYEEIESEG